MFYPSVSLWIVLSLAQHHPGDHHHHPHPEEHLHCIHQTCVRISIRLAKSKETEREIKKEKKTEILLVPHI